MLERKNDPPFGEAETNRIAVLETNRVAGLETNRIAVFKVRFAFVDVPIVELCSAACAVHGLADGRSVVDQDEPNHRQTHPTAIPHIPIASAHCGNGLSVPL